MKYKGYIEYFTYRSPDLTYGIYNLVGDDLEDGEIKCVGSVIGIDVGDFLEIEGSEEVHPTYGPQIRVSSYRVLPMEDLIGAERYLASGAIKGIGAALASKIVKKFKNDTFRIMEEEPERLAEIKGISLRMASEIGAQVVAKRDLREAMVYLSSFGISNTTAVKIYKKYDSRIYTIFQENPYLLAEEVRGIGFATADEIALKSGISMNNPKRIQSGIIYMLRSFSENGNTYMPCEMLLSEASKMLGVTEEEVEEQFFPLAMEKKIIHKKEYVYLILKLSLQKIPGTVLRPVIHNYYLCFEAARTYPVNNSFYCINLVITWDDDRKNKLFLSQTHFRSPFYIFP